MTNWLDLLIKTGLFIWGVVLIVCSIVGSVKLTFPNKPISQKDRVLRSTVVWFLMNLAVPGLLFVASAFSSERIQFEDIVRIILTSAVFLPLTFVAALGTYQKLWARTKMPDDLLFLDEDNKPKD